MAVVNRAGRAYTGIPAQIFLSFLDYGRGTQRYIERLTILDKIFAYLRGYLPVMMENALDEYNQVYYPKLENIDRELLTAYQDYKPGFEGESYDPDENEFNMKLRAIFIDLAEVTAMSRAIDKQKMDAEGFEA